MQYAEDFILLPCGYNNSLIWNRVGYFPTSFNMISLAMLQSRYNVMASDVAALLSSIILTYMESVKQYMSAIHKILAKKSPGYTPPRPISSTTVCWS